MSQMELIHLSLHQRNPINQFSTKYFQCKIIYNEYRLFFFISLAKYCLFICIFLFLTITNTFVRLPGIRKVTRPLEVLLTKLCSRILLALLGVYEINYKYKRQDSKRHPNIIISSQSTIIDWLVLMYNYSPKFLVIAKSENNDKDYFIELSYFMIFSYSMGLKFPKAIPNGKKFDFDKYVLERNHVPMVIFPECTKTNRHGVLSIRSNLLDAMYSIIKKHEKLLIRSEIVINKNGDYNTTDERGYYYLFLQCLNYYVPIEIYSQDIGNETFSEDEISFDKSKFKSVNEYFDSNLQEFLMEPNHRNTVKLTYKDHIKFLEYYKKTSSDKNASYVKKDK